MSGMVRSPFVSAARRPRTNRDAVVTNREAPPCAESRDRRSVVTGEGGATPAGRPAPRGAGSRPREFEGVAPPSPVTLALDPERAANAPPRRRVTPRSATKSSFSKDFAVAPARRASFGHDSRPTDGAGSGADKGASSAPSAAGPISTPPAAIRTGCTSTAIARSTRRPGRAAVDGRSAAARLKRALAVGEPRARRDASIARCVEASTGRRGSGPGRRRRGLRRSPRSTSLPRREEPPHVRQIP